MRIALVTHKSSDGHDTGWGHPERPERITAVIEGVHASGLDVVAVDAVAASTDVLELVHSPDHVVAIERFCRDGGGAIDRDTLASTGSWEAALHSAGAGPTAIDTLARDLADAAFIATRPPGHHATKDHAMGFCLFNNIAVAAATLRAKGERVAIVDWDVHHGNGTQEVFADDEDVLYISWHQHPWYPLTGGYEQIGARGPAGTLVNLPWPAGTEGAPYRWSMATIVAPILEQFRPDWVLVSAGFDAHRADPLAGIRLVAEDFGALSAAVAAIAPPGRLLFFLEGGYDLDALRDSVAQTVAAVAKPSEVAAASLTGPVAELAAKAWEVSSTVWDL